MSHLDSDPLVSGQTEAIFNAMVATGADLAGLLALIASAYADGGNHVLDRLHAKARAASD